MRDTWLANVRTPAIKPLPAKPAEPLSFDPRAALQDHYRNVAECRMVGMPFMNPGLVVEVVASCRLQGDWLAALVTPWCIMMVLMPGGGALWKDTGLGARREVALPVGVVSFIADEGPASLPCLQYCPIVAPVSHLVDQAQAVELAIEAHETCLIAPSLSSEGIEGVGPRPEPSHSASRRSFLLGNGR